MSEPTIRYFGLDWSSGFDGPGTRVVLYLQGCRLACPWCHSPHSRPHRSPLLFQEQTCRNCGRCVAACTSGVHRMQGGRHVVNRTGCLACGDCIDACPSSGRNLDRAGVLCLPTRQSDPMGLAERMWPQLRLLRDLGGLTVSGGEPLLQSTALVPLLRILDDRGIHLAVETSGILSAPVPEELFDLVDLWLLGIRPERWNHLGSSRTGASDSFRQILAGLGPDRVLARIPLIPGFTDSRPDLEEMADTMESLGLKQVQLLPFNSNTAHYHELIGVPCPLAGVKTQEPSRLEWFQRWFRDLGFDTRLVQRS